MKTRTAVKFSLTVLGAALLYGFMSWGSYGLPTGFQTWGLLVTVVLGTYSWLPSFLAGLLVGRRGVLLGVLTVVGGAVSKVGFDDMFSPMVYTDDWDAPIENLTQGLVALVTAAISGIAGQCISRHRSPDKALQPIARDNARSARTAALGMTKIGTALKFSLIALGAALLYGFMSWGSYGLPTAIDPKYGFAYWGLLTAVLGTYAWLPSFLAALLAGRRGVLLGVLTVVGGTASKLILHGTFSPAVHIDDWYPPIVKLTQGLVAVVTATVSVIAAQCISRHRRCNKPLQPVARENARYC